MGNVEFYSSGARIAGQLFSPDPSNRKGPYPGIVVCHGLGSRKENHAPICTFLAEHGYLVLAFDFRGHGESEGMLDEHTGDDVQAALDFLARQPGVATDRLALRGSSMGALFALRAAATDTRVKAIVLIAPAMDARFAAGVESGFVQRMLEREQMPARMNPEAFVRALHSRDSRDEIAAIAPRAVMLIQCKGDEVVPYQWTEELFARAGEPKRLVLIDGGSHTFAQQDAGMHRATLEWFRMKMSE